MSGSRWIFPSRGVELGTGVPLLNVLLMSIPFAPPFISFFALGNLLLHSPPEPEIASGVMSSFEYRQRSSKRWLICYCSRNGWGIELHPSPNCNIKRNWELIVVRRRHNRLFQLFA